MASHLNTVIVPAAPEFKKHPILVLQHAITPYSEKEKASFARTKWFAKEGRGYNLLQSTKPQTLSYDMRTSPVALARICEKLHDWTDAYPWTDDQILEWVSIYQFSRAGSGAAHNIYYEITHTEPGPGSVTSEISKVYVPKVKLRLAYNPRELSVCPRLGVEH